MQKNFEILHSNPPSPHMCAMMRAASKVCALHYLNIHATFFFRLILTYVLDLLYGSHIGHLTIHFYAAILSTAQTNMTN